MKRTGKSEIMRLADIVADVDITDKDDACLFLIASIGVELLKTSRYDVAPRVRKLADLMEKDDAPRP